MMLFAKIHPMPEHVLYGIDLCCNTIFSTWLAYMCALSRGMLVM